MKKIILIFIFIASNSMSSQLVKQLWHEGITKELKKESHIWKEKIDCTEKNNKQNCVKTVIDEKKFITKYQLKNGSYELFSKIFFQDEFTMINEMGEDKEITIFNPSGWIISKKWIYADKSEDIIKYEYDDNSNIIRIYEKDAFGDIQKEKLTYKNNRLVLIESLDEDNNKLMERKFIYNQSGLLILQQKFQDEKLVLKTEYQYNEKKQLIKQKSTGTNRLSGKPLGVDITSYTYFDNGKTKTEKNIRYYPEGADIRYETTTLYFENELVSKETYTDNKYNRTETTTYKYTY